MSEFPALVFSQCFAFFADKIMFFFQQQILYTTFDPQPIKKKNYVQASHRKNNSDEQCAITMPRLIGLILLGLSLQDQLAHTRLFANNFFLCCRCGRHGHHRRWICCSRGSYHRFGLFIFYPRIMKISISKQYLGDYTELQYSVVLYCTSPPKPNPVIFLELTYSTCTLWKERRCGYVLVKDRLSAIYL